MCVRKRDSKVRRKASTPSKFHSKGKRSDLMASKQANEINNSKESKANSTGNGKGRGKIHFSCVESRKRIIKKRKKAQREKNEGGNQHPLKQRKEERATGIMRVNQRNPPPSIRSRFISQRATKSEPRGSAVILDPALTFYPEKSLRNKGNFTCGGFYLKDKGKENWEKLRKRDQP